MSRNWDVVRGILLGIQESFPEKDPAGIARDMHRWLDGEFDKEVVTPSVVDRHLRFLLDEDLIEAESPVTRGAETSWRISGLTWDGYRLMVDIRDDVRWEKTKERVGDGGEFLSVEGLREVAKKVYREHFGLE